MNIEIQIQSIIVSFVYGMFSSLIYNLLYLFLYSNNNILRIISNLLYTFFIFTLFFYLMLLINNASIHPYFILVFITGFIFGNYKIKEIRICSKKNKRK